MKDGITIVLDFSRYKTIAFASANSNPKNPNTWKVFPSTV